MKALGGEMSIESTPGLGTRMVARCPHLGFGENEAATRQTTNTDKHATTREATKLKKLPSNVTVEVEASYVKIS